MGSKSMSPELSADTEILGEMERARTHLMETMKTTDADFLDCHHWTMRWVRTVDSIEWDLRLRGHHPVILNMRQVQIQFRRKETGIGVSGGEHVALLVNLKTRWMLIDHTHNQFDLPLHIIQNRKGVEVGYRAVWASLSCHIIQSVHMEEVIVRWLAFLRAKRYVSEVSSSGILYHDKTESFGEPPDPAKYARMAAKADS